MYSHRSRGLWIIAGVLLLTAATRIVNVGGWPVWTDEGWSTWAISDPSLGAIIEKVQSDTHPPLYFVTLGVWSTLAGDSRIALRSLAIFAGLLTVAVTYRIGADWFGRAASLYGTLLLAVLDIAIYYSQEIRHYGFLALSTSLMMLFFLRYLRRPRLPTLILYGGSVAFMLYSMYLGVLVLGVQIVIGLLAWRGKIWPKVGLIGAWGAAGLVFLPWLGGALRQSDFIAGTVSGLTRYPTTPEGVLAVAMVLFGGQIALTGAMGILGASRIVISRDSSLRWLAQMTILLTGVGLFGVMIVANLRLATLLPRFLVFLTPMLALVCGYGLSLIADAHARRALAVVLVAISLLTTEFAQPRLNYDDAARALAADYSPGDLIILENGWDDNAFRYETRLAVRALDADPHIIRTLPWVDNRKRDVPVVPEVEGDLRANRRVWVVNWLQPAQVIPYLDGGGEGYARILRRAIPVQGAYRELFADQTIDVVLYARPDPTIASRQFGGLVTLNGALFSGTAYSGGVFHVDLWWSALKPPPLDYSAGVFLLDSGGVSRAQHDGPPGGQPTSSWSPGTPYTDRHTLTIPRDLPPGEYQVGVQVYWFGDNKPLEVEGGKYVLLGSIMVNSAP